MQRLRQHPVHVLGESRVTGGEGVRRPEDSLLAEEGADVRWVLSGEGGGLDETQPRLGAREEAVAVASDADGAEAEKAEDFPLRALEAVLEEATGYYHQKMRRVKLLTDYCLESITAELKTPGWGPGTGEAGFQRLLPLRRAMTELESDIHVI